MTRSISLTVNGRPIEATVEPRTHLADFVRDTLRLTGTHLGCEHGVCGACTVMLDGAPVRGCIAYAVACDGGEVRTVEGFGDDPLMQALREAFTSHHALQCGYCTPGMLITAYDIVRRLPGADETRVREELSGNLCRCTGYGGIVEAVKSVLADPPALGVRAPLEADAAIPAVVPSHPRVLPAASRVPAAVRESTRAVQSASVAGVRSGTAASFGKAASGAPSTSTPTSGMSPAAPVPSAPPTPDDSRTGHEITLAIAPDALWLALHDTAAVVRCLPGASLTSPADADPLAFEMSVAIGPMRARFQGVAHVTFDDRRRIGVIEGRGHDSRTRSTSQGRVELSVRPAPTGGSVLALGLDYTLAGPLAQFSRGAVVDTIVEQLLHRFATNLASAASGRDIGASPPLGALALAIAGFRRRLQRWFEESGG